MTLNEFVDDVLRSRPAPKVEDWRGDTPPAPYATSPGPTADRMGLPVGPPQQAGGAAPARSSDLERLADAPENAKPRLVAAAVGGAVLGWKVLGVFGALVGGAGGAAWSIYREARLGLASAKSNGLGDEFDALVARARAIAG